MNNPKISVILPVYNVEKYLVDCLDSVLNQTLRDIEVICVNDGSTDNSLSILNDYASKDERIKIIDKENEGLGYTRKVGLDNATGKYILFIDSDDYYSELTAFEELYDYIEKLKSDIVIFDVIKKDDSTKNIIYITDSYNEDVNFTYRDVENIFEHIALSTQKLYSRSFLSKYDDWYFPKKIKFEDVPFHYQVITRAKISYFKRYFYVWRVRKNSISTKKFSYRDIFDNLIVIKKIYEITRNIVSNLEFLDYFYQFFYIRLFDFFIRDSLYIKDIDVIRQIIETIKSFDTSNLFDLKNREAYFFIQAGLRMTPENYMEYLNRKILRYSNKVRDNIVKNLDNAIKDRDKQILIKKQAIKRLQNSWSYRIGRLITYPLSIPLELYKYIRDYNLIKNSGLFDSEYYLTNNEDIKKAKVDPIKHYLKFGWKEGRNPSAKFDGNKYLNKIPDAIVSGICPLVHYIKIGKDEK